MSSDSIGFIGSIILIVILLCVLWGVNSFSCWMKWGSSGMDVRYRPFSGCQIEKEKGVWIPSDSYRVL